MATCLELAGAKYPEKLNEIPLKLHASRSLVPAMLGKELPRDHAYFFNHAGSHALVKGNYKIVREPNSAWELYDLSNNRTETKNIAQEHPEVVSELSKLWKRWSTK